MDTATRTTLPATPDQITPIALDDLHESPFNPRRSFKALDELAASIKAEGRVHEPLLVRPRQQTDDAGDAGGRDTKTADLFEKVAA